MDLLQRRQLKGTLARVGLTLSGISIFIITYMLVAPVLTQEWEAVCGIEEHTHIETCYADTLVCELEEAEAVVTDHEHSDECYEIREEEVLICNQEVVEGHTHSDDCYTGGEKTLVCTEPTGGHQHDDSCYTVETVTKYRTETREVTETVTVEDTEERDITDEEGNVIDTETVVTSHEETRVTGTEEVQVEDGTEEVRTLTCGEGESQGHEHDDSCYETTEKTLSCTQEESEGHQHDDSCYEKRQVKELVCTEGGTEGHTHSEECYEHILTCEMEEHTHTDHCYQKPEGEIHYTCGFLTEHIHKDTCYFEDGSLKCSITEHLHTDECLLPVVTLEDETFTAESDDGVVVLNLQVDGPVAIPASQTEEEQPETDEAEDAQPEIDMDAFELVLTATYDMDTREEYEALAAEQGEVMMVQVFNYSLTYNGQKVDLSRCEVTAELSPSEEFEEMLNSDPEEFEEMLSTLAETVNILAENSEEEAFAEDSEENEENSEEETLDDADVPMTGAPSNEAIQNEINLQTFADAEEKPGVVAYGITRKVNPDFTVQFYANLDVPNKEIEGTELSFIDTSGKKLPANGTTPNLTNLFIDGSGAVIFTKELTEVYKAEKKDFNPRLKDGLNINYLNSLRDNEHYEATALWVLEDGKEPDSKEEKDWKIYPVTDNEAQVAFTNDESRRGLKDENERDYIVVKQGTVMRLVYEPTTQSKNFASTFYDYDISTGKVHRAKPPEDPNQYVYKTAGQTFSGDTLTKEVLDWAAGLSGWDKHLYAYTKEQGINSIGNYSGSGTKLAFGNVNTGTNLGRLTWSKDGVSNELNKYNNNGYLGCTFGLVTGLNPDGTIQYASGINAPKLFNEGSTTGKTTYGNYSLNFNRAGDTYTLTAVNGTGAAGLDTFNNPTNSTGTHTKIWTNNFWPMDSAPSFGTGTHDVKFGATKTFKGGEHEIRFGPITQKDSDYTFPESDDGQYHNSYFGMKYSMDFELVEGYIGPLEYYFYGDDDMWVFLDGELVCDIGGVHSSVGEYVNLWDYIPKDRNEKEIHNLSVFYTERGASGSTCWMQFTLPQVSEVFNKPDEKNVGLIISKTSKGAVVDEEQEFPFVLKLSRTYNQHAFRFLNAEGGEITDRKKVWEKDKYNGENEEEGTVETVGSSITYFFKLKNGEKLEILSLPTGTKYNVEETFTDVNCTTTVSTDGGEAEETLWVEGTLSADDDDGDIVKPVTVAYTNTFQYALPSTGGAGTTLLYTTGMALIFVAGCLMYKTWRRSRRAERGESV